MDIFITERGIAINPKHGELIARLREETKLKILTMDELQAIVHRYTGIPNVLPKSDKIIGYSVYRDGSIIDTIYGI